ncbi:MAG: hypothetical protein M3R15_15210 [Acidobacteriota bacterium]|nr:hypothetical protein [Acidobacteriota bacterium]
MRDAVDGDDDVGVPVVILLDDARLLQNGEEHGEERAQRCGCDGVERGTHLGVAGDVRGN